MCVNVAASEFTDLAYCSTIAALCEATGVDPASLCLEITESVLIDDVPGALSAFAASSGSASSSHSTTSERATAR